MQFKMDFYICSVSDKFEILLYVSMRPVSSMRRVLFDCLMLWAALRHCSYTSLISCAYVSSIHVASLKVPHLKEPKQHSSVQICTRGPEHDSKDKTQRPCLVWEVWWA